MRTIVKWYQRTLCWFEYIQNVKTNSFISMFPFPSKIYFCKREEFIQIAGLFKVCVVCVPPPHRTEPGLSQYQNPFDSEGSRSVDTGERSPHYEDFSSPFHRATAWKRLPGLFSISKHSSHFWPQKNTTLMAAGNLLLQLTNKGKGVSLCCIT